MYWTQKFNEFNKKYWNGALPKVPVVVKDLTSEKAYGFYHYADVDLEIDSLIEIDKHLTHHEKLNVLLHEMCHHAVEVFCDERPYHDHGKEWKEEMRRVGFKGKLHSARGRYKTRNY
jgi:predicted SprT family Zn-dependent metalloprotease